MDSERFTIAVHLTNFHHQKGFHHKLEQIIPDHRHHEQQLQQYLAAPTDIENKADSIKNQVHHRS